MEFTHAEQVEYIRLALALCDGGTLTPAELEAVLAFGELIKRRASSDNAAIYDATEFIYEQLRAARGEAPTQDISYLRDQLRQYIAHEEN